jgi:hypothetical protein
LFGRGGGGERGGEQKEKGQGQKQKQGQKEAVAARDPAGVVQWTHCHPPTPESNILTRIAKLANLSSGYIQSIKNLLEKIQVPVSFVPANSEDLGLHVLIQKCRSNVDSSHYVSFISMVDYIILALHLV